MHRGEVHALLGENGAGKSTLVKILVGAVRPDDGRIVLEGEPVRFRGVGDAVARGIVPIYQQLSLIPHLSVAENLFAFDLARGFGLRRAGERGWQGRARHALRAVGLSVDPRIPAGELSLAQRQLVEISRSVIRDCRVLILDEPTTTLNAAEIEHLFAVVRRLRSQGRGVLFISHRLDEVAAIADRVSVLRDGATVMDGVPISETNTEGIVRAMVGRPVTAAALPQTAQKDEALRGERLTSPGAFADVGVRVRTGEVLGVVGLIGSGAAELGETLAGARVASGRLVVGGRALRPGDRAAALRAGVGFVPADRDRDGVFPTLPVLDNGSVSVLREISRGGWLSRARERSRLLPRLRELSVKPLDPAANIRGLSGGNQQKVLVARCLAGESLKVVVAIEPTRGVDVGARRDIHDALLKAAAGGAGVVVVSSDLDEVVAVSHRVLVMREGRAAAMLPGGSDPAPILAHLSGSAA
jgi:ABC-type sugar transport system ATPase subunit